MHEEYDDGFATLDKEKEVVGVLRPIENIPKKSVAATRRKKGKNKAKNTVLQPWFEAAVGKKMNDDHVKATSQKMREVPTSSRKDNMLDCIQIEVRKYTGI